MTLFGQLHKKAQEAVSSSMGEGESVVLAIPGENGSAIVATNHRIFVFKKGITSGAMFGRQLAAWDYSTIIGVEVKKGVTTTAIVLQVPGVAPVTKYRRYSNGPNSVWEAPNAIMVGVRGIDREIIALQQLVARLQRTSGRPDAATPDPAEQIKNLSELRDQGLLTDGEFAAKKAQVLGL